MLCNVYLHRLDRRRKTARDGGVLVRYADDLPVLCQTRQQADRALAALTGYLAELGLALKPAKTRIVHMTEGGEGFDFLGFHHRLVPARRSRRQVMFLARWPSRTAMQHARDRIRELTARSRLAVPVERVVQDLNAFLRGRSGYFRYGNSAGPFDAIRAHALHRLARFVPPPQAATVIWWALVVHQSPYCMGLISLNGRVVAPGPNRPWREKSSTAR